MQPTPTQNKLQKKLEMKITKNKKKRIKTQLFGLKIIFANISASGPEKFLIISNLNKEVLPSRIIVKRL